MNDNKWIYTFRFSRKESEMRLIAVLPTREILYNITAQLYLICIVINDLSTRWKSSSILYKHLQSHRITETLINKSLYTFQINLFK